MDKSILSLCLVNVLWHKYRKTYVDNFVPLTKTPMTRIRTTEGAERNAGKDKNTRNLPQNSAFSVVESPFLGIHDGTAYALLYNGVLGDKALAGGNVLTHQMFNYIMHEIDAAANMPSEEKSGGGVYLQQNNHLRRGDTVALCQPSIKQYRV